MGSERHAPVPGMQIGSITTTGHSLGGALAALCAADIAECLNSTSAAGAAPAPNPLERLTSPFVAALAGVAATAVGSTQRAPASVMLSNKAEELYDKTHAAVDEFRTAMEAHLKLPGRLVPPVTAVTFGAPRVGDKNFAAKFGLRRCQGHAHISSQTRAVPSASLAHLHGGDHSVGHADGVMMLCNPYLPVVACAFVSRL